MQDKFITENFEIDLTNADITVTEENPRFKDSFWTKYSMPFTVNINRDFISKAGHYNSVIAKGLSRYHYGTHIFEGRMMKGRLEIQDISKDRLQCQIESGFEELPNFDKKLSELPFPVIEVQDVYAHAEEVCQKAWPNVNYNFPKLITYEYDLEQLPWKYFDGLINNREKNDAGTGYYFPRNEVINGTDVANRNIIHPLPYLLYVLQVGFADAGFILEGDVFSDEVLKYRTIYSGEKYYTTADQKFYKEIVTSLEYTPFTSGNQTTFAKKININAPGKYRIVADFLMDPGDIVKIYRDSHLLESIPDTVRHTESIVFEVSIAEAEAGVEIRFEFKGVAKNNSVDEEGKNTGVAQIKINPIRNYTESAEPIPFVFNENRIDIKRAMPDITFGDLVTTIKNWRNYDLIFSGAKVFMNRIVLNDSTEPADFREFEVENPSRKFTDKQSFLIKFPENELATFEDVLFDENGYKLGAKGNKNTSEITINGFAVPLAIWRGRTTAKILDDSSVLQLVNYSGLNNSGLNHATNPPGLHGKELADHLLPWFIRRVTNFIFSWSFIALKNKVRSVNVRSEIFAYNRKMWIKTMTKKQITPKAYQVEITAETMD